MRILGLLAAAMAACALAACDAPKAGDWSVAMRSAGGEEVYLVEGPGGKAAAAHVSQGVAAMSDVETARGFLARPADAEAALENPDVAIKGPGVDIKIADGASEADEGVEMKLGTVKLSASGSDGQAFVAIGGVSEADARRFIDEAESLTPDVKAQMKAAAGLAAP